MRRILTYTALATIMASCGDTSAPKSTVANDRMEHRAEQNEVQIDTLQRRTFMRELISNGRLKAVHRSELSFAVPGTIAEVNAVNGTHVGRGAAIATIDTTDYASQLRAASLSLEKARLSFLDVLVGLGYTLGDTVTPPADVVRLACIRSGYADAMTSLQTARRNFDRCTLMAPFSGKVADIKQNAYEQTNGVFCTLLDDSRLEVRFPVLESEYGLLAVGQEVTVNPYADLKREIKGRITAINPTIDDNGQVQVDATITNDGTLTDGMNVKVFIRQAIGEQLVVPKCAVVIRDNLEVLFRYVDGKAVWTYVHTSLANSREYVVEANTERGADLNEGDLIITSGNLNLADGSEVIIATE